MGPAEQGQVPESPLEQAIKDRGLRGNPDPHTCHVLICPFLAFRGEGIVPSVGIFVLWVPILELFPRCLEHLRLCDCSGQHHRYPRHRVWGKSLASFSLGDSGLD